MNAHERIMEKHKTPYACAKATMLSYATCKRWWRIGRFVDPAHWQDILQAVDCDQPEWYKALAKDY